VRRWTLDFAGIPPSPNDRMGWRVKAHTAKLWRVRAALLALEVKIPPLLRIRLSAVIRRRNLGVADESNDRSRFKHVEDGIVDAGVVPDDTRKYVEWGSVTEERGPKGFTLVIEELEP
jgi:crossover junction endodeoxyribonuclease RusA